MTKQYDNYFGGCPTCGGTDGYLNAGKCHWFVCDEHKVMWCVGYNLFSCWQNETEEEQREAWKAVESYAHVEPGVARNPSADQVRASAEADLRHADALEKFSKDKFGTPTDPDDELPF